MENLPKNLAKILDEQTEAPFVHEECGDTMWEPVLEEESDTKSPAEQFKTEEK